MNLRAVRTVDEIDRRMGNAVECVVRSMQPSFENTTRQICRWLAERCESPIEVMLGAAFWATGRLTYPGSLLIAHPDFIGPHHHLIVLHPQFEWGNYRSDFLVVDRNGLRVLIECDGHDFHERTKEQAERDRSRDREAQALGYYILRFTGSEIYRDSRECIRQIIWFLHERNPT